MTNSLEAKCYEPTQPQKSIILTDKFYNNKHISVIAGWCRINEPVNFDNLELAINKLVENNDAYRIVFTKDENGIHQHFTDYSTLKLEKILVKKPEDIENFLKSISFDIFSEPPVVQHRVMPCRSVLVHAFYPPRVFRSASGAPLLFPHLRYLFSF